MRYLLNFVVIVAWALWLGGTIATFVFGLNLFHKYPDVQYPGVAGQANSAMFLVFGWYELVLFVISLAGTGALLLVYPSKPTVLLLLVLVLAGGTSMMSGFGAAPQIEVLRVEGKTKTPEFKKQHRNAMIFMTAQSIMLLGAGALLLWTITTEPTAVRRQ
jgi:hypothetical protein